MSNNREPTGGLLGLLGVGVAVCCGLPLLLGAGVAVGAAGLALGSAAVAAAGILLGVWGWQRRQRHRCPRDERQQRGTVIRRTDADHR